ncbi:MAG: intermembrane phospholipid transport protein YdbH family protein [Rickettsiales bacterium]
MKKLSVGILIIFAMAVGYATFAPWKVWLKEAISGALEQQGLHDVQFEVHSINTEGVVLTDISMAGDVPVTLDTLTVSYSLEQLLDKQIKDVQAEQITFSYDKIKGVANNVSLHFAPTLKDGWKGEWKVGSVILKNTPLPLPSLKGVGTFVVEEKQRNVRGKFYNLDIAHNLDFVLDMEKADSMRLGINSASLPWSGGMVSTHDVSVPLNAKSPITVPLKVQRVELNSLLRDVTGDRASATGVVSGTLPMVISPNGEVMFKAGSLKAADDGTIVLAPDAIPGDNEQITIVRSVLSNFHYKKLSLNINSGKDDKLSMLLKLSGNNPDVYNGRQVNLNVRLTGDVLSLMQQTIMPMTDPKQYLKQE